MTKPEKMKIIKLNNARLMTPAGESWEHWFDGPGVSDDFMTEREQPEREERELFLTSAGLAYRKPD